MRGARAIVALAGAGVVVAASVMGTLAGAQQRAHDSSITEGIECNACHTPEGWRVGGSVRGGGFDHSRTGFPLTGRHRTVGCTDCHEPGREARRDCVSCHQDEHQGRLGRACDTCHSAVSWQRTNAIEMHRLTRLPLTGMHVLATCTDCHRRNNERQYSATPAECYACHEADYVAATIHPIHDGSGGDPAFPRDCSQCHRANGWSPAFILSGAVAPLASGLRAPRDHDIRFAISFGSHRGAPCESCHLSPSAPRAIACSGCHEHSPLRLRAQHRGRPPLADGQACLSCHPGGRAR